MKNLYSIFTVLVVVSCSPNYNPSGFVSNGAYQSARGSVYLLNPLEDLQ